LIISRTPYRISFFGGGTDYPDWYLKQGGAVLSTSIDKYCYLICRFMPPFFEVRHRIVWSHIETVNTISEILHPAVREGLRYLGFDDSLGIEIHHQGDLPARSGIGSSSSFSVGLINGLLALMGESIDTHSLALKAIELEQEILKESVGSQDQMAAAHGGLNVMQFCEDGSINVEQVDLPQARIAELESHLMLIYTGTSRLSTEVASRITANLPNKAAVLTRMRHMVDEAASLLRGNDSLDGFGELLHEGWTLKRSLAEGVTTSQIDEIYEAARTKGAIGGKLIGAGGGGFMLLFVPPVKQEKVRQVLDRYLAVPFSFENTGSTIIYDDRGERSL
jgi:D-glycero-alpha-D-manno-heptose-7-phosphate kinase